MNADSGPETCYNCNKNLTAPVSVAPFTSGHKLRVEDRSQPMFAQQPDEFGQTALFIGAQVVVNVPAQVILAVIVIGAAADDGIERVQAETLRLAQLPAESAVVPSAAQRPDRIHKRQPGQLVPGRPQVPHFVLARTQ